MEMDFGRLTLSPNVGQCLGNLLEALSLHSDSPKHTRSRITYFNDDKIKLADPFEYEPLGQNHKRRIRLIRLKAGTLDNPQIPCELFTAQFDKVHNPREISTWSTSSENNKPDQDVGNKVDYEALSWCWGTSEPDHAIMINKGGRTFKKRVSRELALALKYLRRPDQDRILWVDALCINQKDFRERNHQVQMMALIYTRATQVCVWLGEDDTASSSAITFIKEKVMTLRNFDTIWREKANAENWQNLLMLMQRTWFSRRWVVQEIALARSATIYCGPDHIEWRDFAIAVELFVEVETATHRLSEVMQQEKKFNFLPGWFDHVSELGASLLVQATGRIFREGRELLSSDAGGKSAAQGNDGNKDDDSQDVHTVDPLKRRSLLSLQYLVTTLSTFKATEPRDAVYSLLAIARDTSPFADMSSPVIDEEYLLASLFERYLEEKPYIVDYSQPYEDVCKDFVLFSIQRCKDIDPVQALDILCRPWAPNPNESEPSPDNSRTLERHDGAGQKKFEKRREAWKVKKPKSGSDKAGARTTNLPGSSATREPAEPVSVPEETPEQYDLKDDPRTTEAYMKDCYENDFQPKVGASFKGVSTRIRDTFPNGRRCKSSITPPTGSHTPPPSASTSPKTSKKREGELPSWISRLDGAPFGLFPQPGMDMLKMGRKNADTLVGTPADGHSNYNAAQTKGLNTNHDFRFIKRPTLGHYSLYVRGFHLDTIKAVGAASQNGQIPSAWLKMAGWYDPETCDPPDEFWRTIVADRGKDNSNPPYYYSRACKESVMKGGIESGAVNTMSLIQSERNSIIAEFCRRVQAVIWERRLIRTERGVLGLARSDVEKGDHICILYGCTVPVILRQHKKETRETIIKEQRSDAAEAMKKLVKRVQLRRERKAEFLAKKANWGKEEQEDITQALGKAKKKLQDMALNTKTGGGKQENKRREAPEAIEDPPKDSPPSGQVLATVAPLTSPQTPHRRTSSPASNYTAADSSAANPITGQGTSKDGSQSDGTTPNQQRKVTSIKIEKREEQVSKDQKEAKEEDPTTWYTFLGASYIHNMMDGQALRVKFYKGLPEHLFELR